MIFKKKPELFTLLKTGSFHFALTDLYLFISNNHGFCYIKKDIFLNKGILINNIDERFFMFKKLVAIFTLAIAGSNLYSESAQPRLSLTGRLAVAQNKIVEIKQNVKSGKTAMKAHCKDTCRACGSSCRTKPCSN